MEPTAQWLKKGIYGSYQNSTFSIYQPFAIGVLRKVARCSTKDGVEGGNLMVSPGQC